MMIDLEQLKADREAGTDGPWGWFGNARMHQIYLATKHSGRRYVMGFRRWGMRGAQPVFQPSNRGLVPASDLVQFEVGDRDVVGVDAAKANDSVYRLDIRGVDCADKYLEWVLYDSNQPITVDTGNSIQKTLAAISKAKGATS